jgi:hypothetical protein
MKVLAVCIGVDSAGNFTKLDNAINDAVSMEEVFQTFGYDTILRKDITVEEWITLSTKLHADLKNYDAFIFFYAGHGLEVDGENYLTTANTSQDQQSKAYYNRLAIRLSEVLELEKSNLSITKIVIVDACRDNPRGVRGAHTADFAPIATPRGTLIAFSTTSGEKAADVGYPNNSAYTGTLVHHLSTSSHIQAESLFKMVRQSVYSITSGKKVTWEHTSLITDFYFQKPTTSSVVFGYPPMYIKDSTYDFSDKNISGIVLPLRSGDWSKQERALNAFLTLPSNTYNVNEKFLIGRLIVRAAVRGNFKAKRILEEDFAAFVAGFTEDKGVNHMLNGMLFELYFNHLGQFRFASENLEAANEILRLRENYLFVKSFDYINTILKAFEDNLFYYPVAANNVNPVIFDIISGEVNGWDGKKQVVKEVHVKGKDVTKMIVAVIGKSISSTIDFKSSLGALNIPLQLINVNSLIALDNVDIKQNEDEDFSL